MTSLYLRVSILIFLNISSYYVYNTFEGYTLYTFIYIIIILFYLYKADKTAKCYAGDIRVLDYNYY